MKKHIRLLVSVLAIITVVSALLTGFMGVVSVSADGSNIQSDKAKKIDAWSGSASGRGPQQVSEGSVYGIRMSYGAPFNAVEVSMPTWSTSDSAATLSIYKWNEGFEQTIAGTPIAKQVFDPARDNAFNKLSFDEQPAGEYLVTISEVRGQVVFSYFLVFGKSEEKLDMVSREAEEWLSHMISEHVLLLGENGYSFNYEGNIPKGVYLRLDERYFSRVIDNIFSNISKYADADEPVKVYLRCVEDEVVLTFENKIRRDKSTTESNKIGLKTCVKMMEKMKGRLLFGVDGNVFTVSVFMRVEEENADSTDS